MIYEYYYIFKAILSTINGKMQSNSNGGYKLLFGQKSDWYNKYCECDNCSRYMVYV